MNKPVQNIVGLCQDDILAKSRDALTKTYEQHLKAINDLCLAAKKAMTEAVASEDFDALERCKTLLERTRAYAEQFETLTEVRVSKAKSRKTDE